MKKAKYFRFALKQKAYLEKAWVLSCFSQTRSSNKPVPFQLFSNGNIYYFINPETNALGEKGEEIYFEDSWPENPPFQFQETLTLYPGDMENVSEKIETNYGRALANQIILAHPLKDKIPYQNEEFSVKKVEAMIYSRLTSDPEYQKTQEPISTDSIYVSEYLDFIDAAIYMTGFSQLCVPSATKKTMTHSTDIEKRRQELLEQYRDRLDDPTIIAKIDAELIKIDKDWIKGDLGEGFYRLNESKFYDVVRKKTHLIHGYEAGFNLNPTIIENSLSEGWDIENLPAMINSLREGTYGRAHQTQLGGAATKTVNRMFQNTKMLNDDCGTKQGWPQTITKELIGFYYIDEKKKTRIITEENLPALLNTVQIIRSPQWCKSPGVNFCRYCIGEPNAENPDALSAYAAAATSQIMYAMMQLFHGTTLSTERFDFERTLF